MAAASHTRSIMLAVVFFFLSTVVTWYFIECGASLYHYDTGKMLLSCSIAGAKWGIQIIAAFVWLGEKRWPFIRNIGFTCFAGSCMLVPFCIPRLQALLPGNGFLLSLAASVSTMLILYYLSVRTCGLSLRWYAGWLACLATAVTLQLTVVFHVL